jgi:hypothetical protein
MKSQNLKTNAHDVPTGILQSNFAEERGKNEPTPAEIRERAFEIHIDVAGFTVATWTTGRRRNASSARGQIETT